MNISKLICLLLKNNLTGIFCWMLKIVLKCCCIQVGAFCWLNGNVIVVLLEYMASQ